MNHSNKFCSRGGIQLDNFDAVSFFFFFFFEKPNSNDTILLEFEISTLFIEKEKRKKRQGYIFNSYASQRKLPFTMDLTFNRRKPFVVNIL